MPDGHLVEADAPLYRPTVLTMDASSTFDDCPGSDGERSPYWVALPRPFYPRWETSYPMTDDLLESVRRHYEEYGRGFSALDPDAAVSHWGAPSIRMSPDGVTLDATVEGRRQGFADATERLAATDYDHSDPMGIRAHTLSDSLALSSVVWERVTAEEDLIARFSPLHLLRRADDGWKFTARASRRSDDPITMRAVDRGSGGEERAAGSDALPEAPEGIEAFFEEYGRAFSTLDGETIAAHWNLPTLVVPPEDVRAVASTAEVETLFDGLDEELRSRGYDRSEAMEVYAHELDDGVVAADVLWHRYAEDGDVIERFAAFHLLLETDDGWKLVVIARHPPENMVSLAEG